MPQEINLNVSPYFDDFDSGRDYYKVLFKPGYPVQARELTTLQSILQNQIEQFGQSFYKEGAKVIPGHFGYNKSYYAIKIDNISNGIPVDAYLTELVGLKITGRSSGVTAIVSGFLYSDESETSNATLYVNYLGSSTTDNASQFFSDGEDLFASDPIISGSIASPVIESGETFATTISNEANAVGSSFSISEGVYFIRGRFITVRDETLILDQYSANPSYRVGLYVNEEIVNADEDDTLNDNSQGFNNYSSPGADRLRITVSLFKKPLDDTDDANFVELVTIQDGVLRSQEKTELSNRVGDEISRRIHQGTGDYVIDQFLVSAKESLNDLKGNGGIFGEGQLTSNGSIPSPDLATYQISPGAAVVKGFDIKTFAPTFIDFPKTRTTKTLENQSLIYNTGSTLVLNRVFGSPSIGVGNTYVLSLRSERVGLGSTTPAGKEIGVARVYDFKLESGSYDSENANLNRWDISLFDVQTVTEINLNEPITLSVPTFVKGNKSGATAYLNSSVAAGTALTVYQKSGDFLVNETFSFDGISNTRVATSVTSYGMSDVKSVYGVVGVANSFTADVIQTPSSTIGIATISAIDAATGFSSIRSSNEFFPGTISVNSLIRFTDTSLPNPVIARVVSVGTTHVVIAGVTTVTGITSSKLPSSTLQVTDLTYLTTKLGDSTDNTLYTRLAKTNISNVSIDKTNLTVRKTYTNLIIDSTKKLSTTVSAGADLRFLPFDEERYTLFRSDGTYEVLTSDKFEFSSDAQELQIYNLSGSDTGATLVATLTKTKVKEKVKRKNRVGTLLVSYSNNSASGVGTTSLNDGLTYGNYPYGTRVQDTEISLNVGDVTDVLGVYESFGSSNPSAPQMTLTTISGPSSKTSDLIIGEEFVGQSSGAVGMVAERIDDLTISFISLNEIGFTEGETVLFAETDIQSVVTNLSASSSNISDEYIFKNGQTGTILGHSSIVRSQKYSAPTRKLKIYYTNGFFESSDEGDFVTANSYKEFDYTNDIQFIGNSRNTDIIDIRPKVSDYTVSEGSRSPLEFHGRTFGSTGNSAANVLASDEAIALDYSYYLGRIDRIFLSRDGKFQVKYGIPSDKPEIPISVDESIEICQAKIPPYLYDVRNVSFNFLQHKRYTMKDIKRLEDRIRNLEYYTTLSLLETDTNNLFIADNDGLNKFKSGFFVDNFSTLQPQDTSREVKNSIDYNAREIRPTHYTTSIDLQPYPTKLSSEDLRFKQPTGVNIRRGEDIVTLDYSETEWLNQPYATKSESVTPFILNFWEGTIALTPSSDVWVDQKRLDAKIIEAQGNYNETLQNAVENLGIDPQTGLAPVVWNSWETFWTGRQVIGGERTVTRSFGGEWRGNLGGGNARRAYGTRTTQVIRQQIQETIDTGYKTRTGTQQQFVEQWDNTSVGDRVVSKDLITSMRSRNITIDGRRFKPKTRVYAFFDGVDVTKFVTPKLLEIEMLSGAFQVGENVVGTVRETGLGEDKDKSKPYIKFRLASPNHREGTFNSPTVVYPINPYNDEAMPTTYSSTSSLLNLDTYSLSNQIDGEYYGFAESGMILKGETSGAQAVISNMRLVSDIAANVQGSFFIPDGDVIGFPSFETGSKTFELSSDNSNNRDLATTHAVETFVSSGTLETVQENIVSVRNARIETIETSQTEDVRRTTGTVVVDSQVLSQSSRQVLIGYYDPLAQTFFVEDETGIFLSKVDLYFRTKDDADIPVGVQIRTTKLGTPTQTVLPFSEVYLDPVNVNVSSDGSVPTTFTFPAPIYLDGQTEYAVVVRSNSAKYSVFISRVGENDLITQEFVAQQPYLGSLFKSQNAAVWEPSQWEDLKFTLYRAEFVENGTLEFFNPTLSVGNGQVAPLIPNPISLESRRIRLGITSAVLDSSLTLGNTLIQKNSNASGKYVGGAGICTGSLQVINPGIGYTPSAVDGGSFTYTGIALTSITGNGINATADIEVSGGIIQSATIVNGGNGYVAGDVVGVSSLGNTPAGSNLRLSIVSIASTTELILANVQGDFKTGTGSTIQYINNSLITTDLNSSTGGGVEANTITVENTGLAFKVNHKNHGMNFEGNKVIISNVQSDVIPTKLTSPYSIDSTDPISVESASNFGLFENVGVGTTNKGYVIIGDEVISYTSTGANQIGGGIVRAISGNSKNYPVGTPVYKYELGGVSLRRINKQHDISSSNIEFDSYYIDLDMSTNGTDRTVGTSYPKLYLGEQKSAGGKSVKATQNIAYEIISPMIQNTTVRGTSLNAQIRTVTGQSIDGSEQTFIDKGFESVTINQTNYLDSQRLICSEVNENEFLTTLPNNKSFNMRVLLGSTDSRISPVVDLQRSNIILTSNRINAPVTDYANDPRVNTIDEDPSAFQYLSKENRLQTPASSIKIILDAHVNVFSDIRAFYAVSNEEKFDPVFTPFPGWNNINGIGNVIDPSLNDGSPYQFVNKSSSLGFTPEELEYKEYQFEVNNLPDFRLYRIKLVLTSTNQAYPPRFKNLRVIALA